MNKNQKKNLTAHISSITYSLITQISKKGPILTRSNDHVEEDIVSTHHVAQLLLDLDPNMFSYYLGLITDWMLNPENSVLESQFAVDTLSTIAPNHEIVRKLIDETIIPTQLESGAFTKYTAFLFGGDYFSTLWCTKILQNCKDKKYQKYLQKSYRYLIDNSNDKGIQLNQIGFLYLLLKKSKLKEGVGIAENLRLKLIDYITNEEITNESLLWNLYIYEDLLYEKKDKESRSIIENKLVNILDLNEEANDFPKVFKDLSEAAHESVLYHCLARTIMVAVNLLTKTDLALICYTINRNLLSGGHDARYIAISKM